MMMQKIKQNGETEKHSISPHIPKGIKYIFIYATLIFLIISGLYLHFEWHKYQGMASSEAVQLAQSLESLLHPRHIKELSGSEADIELPEYSMAKTSLMRLSDTTNPIRFAYLMAERNGELVVLMDSESPDSPDYSPPGQVYDEADDWVWVPFRTGETVITPPISDRWGTWISALVPIKDPESGEIIAIFGIDYSASEWQAALWKQMIPDITVVIVVLLLYFAFLYILLQHYRLTGLYKKMAFEEALYRSVFDQAPIGIAIVNDKNFIYKSDFGNASMNPMFEKILGRKSADLSNIEWPEITHAEDLQADLDQFGRFQKGEINGYTMEKRFFKPDGSIVWSLMKVSPLLGVYEDRSIHLCLLEDITNQKSAEAALIDSEKKYRNITENMSDVVWQMDLNLKTTYISPSVERLLGESPEEHMERKLEEKFPEQTLHKIQPLLYEEMEKEKDPQIDKNRSRTFEAEHYKADGTVIWLEMNVSFIRDDKGNAVGFQGSSRDITQRKTAEIALKENERRESVLLSHLPGLAYRCNYDREWTMQYVSEGCLSLTGYPSESLLNNRDLSYNDLIAIEYRDALWNEWERILAKRQPFKFEYEIISAAGKRKWVLEMGQGIFNNEGEVEALEGMILDISDRKEIENRLRYLNEHDNWTGLYNRDYLESVLNKDIKKKDGLNRAVISINLSTVQLLTSNYGFHYTQNLIKKAAEALRQHCSENCFLFQTYENRFVFYIVDYIDKKELLDFNHTIAETLETLFVTDRIGGGIGILEIEQSDTNIDVDLLLRRLLIASERAIAVSDKDFEVCFYNEEFEALINRERDIREALSAIVADYETNDELFLQYQPVLDLRTNSVCGFEALARLRTEKLGFVSPVEFIPIAEKTKLIIPIGEKVIVNSFHFLNKLKERGYDEISVSINVSAIQLLKPDFTSRLFELIKEMQVNPRNIGIEITESVFAADYENINKIIEKLRNPGMHVAIDDFGTGYSSLAREKELKVDCLKIDKYFVDKLLGADLNKAITSDIISMSHKLGHCTIAEGVEHESQLEYLKEHDCDRIQGNIFSKPLDEEDALEFLKRKNKYDCHSNDSQD